MRTETIVRELFTVTELRELHPAGFARALDEHAQSECNWADWSDEQASLKALDDAVGYDRGYRHGYGGGLADTATLEGRRAWAWMENSLLGPLRVKWLPISKRGRYTRPGRVPDCPLTGYYTDEELIDALRESFAAGMSVGDAMLGLEDRIRKVCDDELDYRTSEEGFIEDSENNEYEYTRNGERA